MTVTAPFPYFGGKRRIAQMVWQHFGDVPNYVEPFAGSLAVLLGRPTPAHTETVNDKDAYLANFWRAIQHAPELVAMHADWPVNEADLHARHRWLVAQGSFREWAISNGDNPLLRIALCGYEGEHDMPPTWSVVAWKAHGGYGGQRKDGANDNADRERVWFSPHCLKPEQMRGLFDDLDVA